MTKKILKNKIKIVGKKPIKQEGVIYKRITFEVPEQLHKKLKIFCIEHGLQINEFLIPLVERALKEKDK